MELASVAEADGGGMFERLLGRWSFVREISGHGSMTGLATFEGVDANYAVYRESGELRLQGGETLRAEQRYVYAKVEDGFAVYFHDTGELFQCVEFNAVEGDVWKGSASHLCKADVYDSEYCFHGEGTFLVRHAVRGPRKDYVIRTVYRRDQMAVR
jgi:hypothetical protein